MTPETFAAFLAFADVLGNLSPFAMAVGIIYVLYKRLYISKTESDERVAREVAASAAQAANATSLLAVEQDKVALLRTELEKREGLYIASLAEMRAGIQAGNEAREKLYAQLAESNREMYRMTDALADLSEAIKRTA